MFQNQIWKYFRQLSHRFYPIRLKSWASVKKKARRTVEITRCDLFRLPGGMNPRRECALVKISFLCTVGVLNRIVLNFIPGYGIRSESGVFSVFGRYRCLWDMFIVCLGYDYGTRLASSPWTRHSPASGAFETCPSCQHDIRILGALAKIMFCGRLLTERQ